MSTEDKTKYYYSYCHKDDLAGPQWITDSRYFRFELTSRRLNDYVSVFDSFDETLETIIENGLPLNDVCVFRFMLRDNSVLEAACAAMRGDKWVKPIQIVVTHHFSIHQ